ncbi:nucleoid-associated protein [Clostridium sp. ZBS18]|uniref:nucleoid-associated protein n=1 Tax=Clostridium sp. ZBS18 TaxID=2949967 RepID=UPI00207A16AC|nr:nucleoid-associated protein [Clostridium sp. ZBS18]
MNTILVKKYITHVLDKNMGIPVLSSKEQNLDNDINEFLEKNISKMLNDQSVKNAVFLNDSKTKLLCEKIMSNDIKDFNLITTEIAMNLFQIIEQDLEIPSGDLVCCLFLLNDTMYLALLKLNYRHSYTHFIDKDRVVQIIKNKVTFLNESQKLDEGAIINLKDLSIKLIEKKCTKNKEYFEYFSKKFLQCKTEISNKEKLKIFNKINDEFSKKYFNSEIVEDLKMKKIILDSIDDNSDLKIDELAEKVFSENEEVKNDYINEFKNKGIYNTTLIESETIKKSFKMQKVKTDSGIEINLPFDIYNDKDKIEFNNNVDGTISIVLKNISKIISK